MYVFFSLLVCKDGRLEIQRINGEVKNKEEKKKPEKKAEKNVYFHSFSGGTIKLITVLSVCKTRWVIQGEYAYIQYMIGFFSNHLAVYGRIFFSFSLTIIILDAVPNHSNGK